MSSHVFLMPLRGPRSIPVALLAIICPGWACSYGVDFANFGDFPSLINLDLTLVPQGKQLYIYLVGWATFLSKMLLLLVRLVTMIHHYRWTHC